MGAVLLEVAVTGVADDVSGKKKIQNCCQKPRKTDIKKTTWRWHAKGKHSSQNFEGKQSITQRRFYYYCKLIRTDQNDFRYQHFVAVSGNPGVKVPVVDNGLSSHEQAHYLTTSPDKNSIEFEFQTDRNVYMDLRQLYLALKTKLVKGHGFDAYKKNRKKGAQ